MKLAPFFEKLSNFGDFLPFYPIRVLTQIMLFWQMIAYRQGFNRTDPNFCYSSTPGPKKNWQGQFCLKTNSLVNPLGFESWPNW